MLTTDVVSGIGEDALVEGVVVEDGGDDVRGHGLGVGAVQRRRRPALAPASGD